MRLMTEWNRLHGPYRLSSTRGLSFNLCKGGRKQHGQDNFQYDLKNSFRCRWFGERLIQRKCVVTKERSMDWSVGRPACAIASTSSLCSISSTR